MESFTSRPTGAFAQAARAPQAAGTEEQKDASRLEGVLRRIGDRMEAIAVVTTNLVGDLSPILAPPSPSTPAGEASPTGHTQLLAALMAIERVLTEHHRDLTALRDRIVL